MLNLLKMKHVLAAASCKSSSSEAIASIFLSDDRTQTQIFKIEWHEGNHARYCLYYASLLETFFSRYCTDIYDRKFIIRLWISSGTKVLECAINATMLAIFDSGISISDIFVALQQDDTLRVYNKKDEPVFELHDEIFSSSEDKSDISKKHLTAKEIRQKMIFEIENKFTFKLCTFNFQYLELFY
ncbi:putative Exosomal 3'-5' exoribonuclease complex, subunit Rrp46 [Pseudoloma neurophilia]|uniref:Putative Exosomal 3'-5' exoribonuclease complex, subunit Rrp46 n=1 Tax=Pseudoloma neurophilia TaxID=146866 RepID=A0A0R0LWI1_9MICR|nr:putative Exosomal 3'-5' exoribonuclease complex, subunit Rrp46 [Pseudoloma neurophilia]